MLQIEELSGDFNPYYHGPGDTIAHMDLDYWEAQMRALVASMAVLTEPFSSHPTPFLPTPSASPTATPSRTVQPTSTPSSQPQPPTTSTAQASATRSPSTASPGATTAIPTTGTRTSPTSPPTGLPLPLPYAVYLPLTEQSLP